jgi:hypothetical protein
MSSELRIYHHPSPWRAGINRRPYDGSLSQSSGGVYPRPYWVAVNRNRSDAIMLFRVKGKKMGSRRTAHGTGLGLKDRRWEG